MKTVSKILMILLLVGSFALSATLQTIGMYAPNENITVHINNQAVDHKNWIGIYPKGSSNAWSNVINWKWTKGKSSVNLKGLPDGKYEARLFYNNSFTLEAKTAFTVASTMIKTKKTMYGVNENITVLTGDYADALKAWVGIYPAGSSNDWDNVLDWKWANNNKIGIDGLPKGKYEARLFFHNSFTLEAKTAFNVADGAEAISNVKNTGVNQVVTVTVNQHHVPKDWVGIFKKGTQKKWGNQIAWNFVDGKNSVSINRDKKPMPAGEYEVALFFDNSIDKVEASVGFNVKGGGNGDKVYPPEVKLTRKIVDPIGRPVQKFASYVDRSFDNTVTRKVTRVTNREQDNKGFNSHQYPKQGSAWNSDMSLLRLTGRIYDAETLKEIPLTKDKTGGEVYNLMKSPESGSSSIRWSKYNPNILYVMSGENKFYKLTINVNKTAVTEELVIDLSNTAHPLFNIGQNEGNIDYEDKYVVLTSLDGNDVYATLLDIKTKSLVWAPKKLAFTKSQFDWMSISPSGKYILVSASNNGKNQIDLYDAKTFTLIKEKFTTSAGHGDIGKNALNEDIYVQWEQDGYSAYNLKTKETIQLLDFKVGSAHVSCRNYKRKGWCYVSSSYKGFRETFALKLDGSKTVQRFAKSYAKGDEDGDNYNYSKYPTGIPSPDGTRVLFWSDYGNPEGYSYNTKTVEGRQHYYNRDTYQVRITQ